MMLAIGYGDGDEQKSLRAGGKKQNETESLPHLRQA
jgi:hypothetical protein